MSVDKNVYTKKYVKAARTAQTLQKAAPRVKSAIRLAAK